MKFYIDIDNTICKTKSGDYPNSKPMQDRIQKINRLYESGHTVVYWTARGSRSGQDWQELTNKQLDEWGVKRHSIVFGKPDYDIFVDDKSINSSQYF